jgi:Spy/CpxP family protein refolding chaperone
MKFTYMTLAFALIASTPVMAEANNSNEQGQGVSENSKREHGKKWKKHKREAREDRAHKQKKGGRHGKGMLGKFKQVWKKLDLNEKQRDQLFELQQEHRKEVFSNELDHERANYNLHKALGREKLDDGELNTSIDTVASSFRKGLEAKIGFVKKMREILSPDQAKKLHKIMAKWHQNQPPRPPR